MVSVYNKILIDFRLLFDIDIGIIEVIKQNYNNPIFIDTTYLDNVKHSALIFELLEQEVYDPLDLVFKDKTINRKDILDDLLLNEYEDILQNSIPTNIINLLETYIETGTIEIIILCKNKHEEQFIKNKYTKLQTTIFDKDINIAMYDCIFIKHIEDLKNITNLNGKNIFLANYKYNFENQELMIPKMYITSEIIHTNKISIIDVYNKFTYLG